MAVKNIDQIKIPGFGEYSLYSFNYSPGFASVYGYVEAEFINKSGEYNTEQLDEELDSLTFFPITITTGDGVINTFGKFIMVSYEVVKNGNFKVLKIKFGDESVKLDRYLVALRGTVGYDSVALADMSTKEQGRILCETQLSENDLFSRVIWVGTSDEACKEDILGELNQDPCDPCKAVDNENIINKINCDIYYLNHRRRYNYSFSELLAALNNANLGFTFSIEGSFENYKFEYIGSIREVLNNICSELGLTFFYSPSSTNSTISIVDIRAGIEIDLKSAESLQNKNKITEQTTKKSREGSSDIFGLASFQRETEEKNYGCALNSCQKIKMHPITLDDLFGGDAAHFSEDELLTDKPSLIRMFEFYCTLMEQTGREFRDLFLWYAGYEFKTAQNLEDNAIDKTLTALNGMTVKKVFWSGSADSGSQSLYNILKVLVTAKNFDAAKDFTFNKKTYFFLAKIDVLQDEKVHNVETNIAKTFLGKYWIRRFKQYWGGIGYNALAPDGDSINYIDFRSPISLPFADIVVEATGSLKNSPLFQKDPNGFGDSIAEGDSPGTLRARDTFYLLTRPSKFYPTAISDPVKEAVKQAVNQYGIKEVSVPTDLNNLLKSLVADYNPSEYRVFMVDEIGDADISFLPTPDTQPDEEDNVVIQVNVCNRYTSYGLADADTIRFDVKFKEAVFSMMMPVQSFSIGDDDQPHDGYTVIISRDGNDTPVVLPKTEIFSYGNHDASSNLGISFSNYNATTNDLKFLTKTQDSSYCKLDMDGIQNLLDGLSSLLNYSQGISSDKSIKVEGVPYDFYTVKDGLKSMSISIGSAGVSTDIAFSNIFPFHLKPDEFLKQLRYQHLKQVESRYVQGSIPPSDTIPEVPGF